MTGVCSIASGNGLKYPPGAGKGEGSDESFEMIKTIWKKEGRRGAEDDTGTVL